MRTISPRRLISRAAWCERLGRARRLARARLLERGDDAPPLSVAGARRTALRMRSSNRTSPTASRCRSSSSASAAVSRSAYASLVRRSAGARVLPDAHLRAAPRHRAADVEHDARAEVRLLLVLAHDPAIGARGDLPVDVAKVVARLIRPVLGELDREALARRPVKSGHEAVDNPTSDDLDAPQRSEAGWVEEVGAVARADSIELGKVIGPWEA